MSHSVHRLHLASVNVPSRLQTREKYSESRVDVYAYLVITRSDVLLIDTGVGEGSQYIERKFAPHRTPIDTGCEFY